MVAPGPPAPVPVPPESAAHPDDPENDGLPLGSLDYTRNFFDRNGNGVTNIDDVTQYISDQASLAISDLTDVEFYRGFGAGLWANPSEAVSSLWSLLKGAGKLAYKFSAPNVIYKSVRFLFDGEYRKAQIQASYRLAQKIKHFATTTASWMTEIAKAIGQALNQGTAKLIEFITTGTFPGSGQLSHGAKIAVDLVFMLILEAEQYWRDKEPYDRGYVFGYVTAEIIINVVAGLLAAPTGGAAAAVTLARHAPRLLKLLKVAKTKLGVLVKKFGTKIEEVFNAFIKRIEAVAGKKPAAAASWCFVAGTSIATAAGPLPIEQITPGTLVLSAHESTGETAFQPVGECYQRTTRDLWQITYDHDSDTSTAPAVLTTTPEHPFFVPDPQQGHRTIPASELAPGTKLFRSTKQTVSVETSSYLPSPRSRTVYNFAVADHHTYFAGEGGVWVHNLCTAALERYANAHQLFIDEALKRGQSVPDALDEALERLISKSKADKLTEKEFNQAVAHAYDQLPTNALGTQSRSQWDEIMSEKSERLGNFNRGNSADRIRDEYYFSRGGTSQLHIVKQSGESGYYRLDNYIPGQSIVSRKDTDSIDTITSALLEIGDKYDIGRFIANTPHNRKQLGESAFASGLPQLTGDLILEIPPRINGAPLPNGVRTMAQNLGIKILDYSGKNLSSP